MIIITIIIVIIIIIIIIVIIIMIINIMHDYWPTWDQCKIKRGIKTSLSAGFMVVMIWGNIIKCIFNC